MLHNLIRLHICSLHNSRLGRCNFRAQVTGHQFPLRPCGFNNRKCMPGQFKCNIWGQRDFNLVISLLNHAHRIVFRYRCASNRCYRVSNDHEIEMRLLAKGYDLLEFIQRVSVLTEESAELIPDQYDFGVIIVDNIKDPFTQGIGSQRQRRYAFFSCKLKNAVHQPRNFTALF